MKRIAYADNTGYVYIVTPAYNDLLRNQDIGDDDFLNYVIEKDIPKTARILIIDDEDPQVSRVLNNRAMRDNWRLTSLGLAIDQEV